MTAEKNKKTKQSKQKNKPQKDKPRKKIKKSEKKMAPQKNRRSSSKRPQKNPRKSRRKKRGRAKKPFFLIPAAVLALGVLGLFIWYGSFEKLDLEQYVDVSYTGYDTEGTASLSIRETEEEIPFLEDVELCLLSENGSLQNGDSLEIRFIYDEEEAKEQKLRIPSDDCQITVSGLPEGKALSEDDLFRGLSVSYDGIAPLLSVAVANESADSFLSTVSYEIVDRKTFYDLGDTFSVRAVFSEKDAIVNEYIVAPSENGYIREYSVTGVDRYVRDASELSADMIQTLDEAASSLFGDATEYGLRIFSEANLMPIWVNGKTTFVWSNPRLISAYLNLLDPEYFETAKTHNNDVKLVYSATLSQADGVACNAEVVVQFNDLRKKADGTYDLSLDSGRIIAASYKNSHIKALVTDSYNKEYTAEKLAIDSSL